MFTEARINLWLMAFGFACVIASTIRMGLMSFDRRFLIDALPLAVMALALLAFSYYLGGASLCERGINGAVIMAGKYSPLLALIFVAMGVATVIINQYQSVVIHYMNGSKGVWGSLFAAYMMPGSLTSMPIVRELWNGGVNRIPLTLFMLNSPLVGWQLVLMTEPMLGWKIAGTRFAFGVVISFLLTVVGWICTGLLS